MKEALTIEDVCFSYDSKRVVGNLNFRAAEGEIVGVIGKNGSGKTTLLRLIAGWLKPESGEVKLFGRNVATMNTVERARTLAFLSQSSEFTMDMRVYELILLGRAPYLGRFQEPGSTDLEMTRWAMEMTDTWAFRSSPVSSLSAGERQRVMMSRALAQGTPVLLLDEPTSNLDIAHQRMVMDNITWMRKEKRTTVVLVSHDVNLTSRYTDSVLLMAEGRKVAWGPGPEVLTRGNLKDTYGVDLVIEERRGKKIVLQWENGDTCAPWEQ